MKIKNNHSKWSVIIKKLDYSSIDFYNEFIEALQHHGYKDLSVSLTSFSKSKIMSSKRFYLKVTWRNYDYYLYASSRLDGFYVSWHLVLKHSFYQLLLYKIPITGYKLGEKVFPKTYNKIKMALIFMNCAHGSILKIIDTIICKQRLNNLTEKDRVPIVDKVYRKLDYVY